MPRSRSLTEADITKAALTIIDRDGLAQLSMRSVARTLGMGAMSLYRYVKDRDDLERLVLDSVLGHVRLSAPQNAAWRDNVLTLAERVRHAISAHPELVPLVLTRRHTSLTSLRWAEAMLQALALGGFDDEARAIAFRGLLSFILGSVQVDHYGPLSGEGTTALASLPSNEFPHLAETARAARRLTADRTFRKGLHALLDGLTQHTTR